MKYLLSLMLLISFVGTCIGDIDCLPGDVYYTISVPEGWKVVGMGCCGIAASDSTNPARGIIALNHLHQGFNVLPAYITPETYLEHYMPQDFSLGDSIVTDMSFIDYEDNQDMANAFASYAGSLRQESRCVVRSQLMAYLQKDLLPLLQQN